MVTFESVCEAAMAFPGMEKGMSYGTPAFRVRGKLVARLREDGETLVISVEIAERELLLAAAPAQFYLTDHYRAYPYILARLPQTDLEDLRPLFEQAWRAAASKRDVASFDSDREDS